MGPPIEHARAVHGEGVLLKGLLFTFVIGIWLAIILWGRSTWAKRSLLFVRVRRPRWLIVDLVQTGVFAGVIAVNEFSHLQGIAIPCRARNVLMVLFLSSCPYVLVGRGVQLWRASTAMKHKLADAARLQRMERVSGLQPFIGTLVCVGISLSNAPLCLGAAQMCKAECYWGSQYLLLLPMIAVTNAYTWIIWWLLRRTHKMERTGLLNEMERFAVWPCSIIGVGLITSMLMDIGVIAAYPAHFLCSLYWIFALISKFVIIHAIPSFRFGYAPTCELWEYDCWESYHRLRSRHHHQVSPFDHVVDTLRLRAAAHKYKTPGDIYVALNSARARMGQLVEEQGQVPPPPVPPSGEDGRRIASGGGGHGGGGGGGGSGNAPAPAAAPSSSTMPAIISEEEEPARKPLSFNYSTSTSARPASMGIATSVRRASSRGPAPYYAKKASSSTSSRRSSADPSPRSQSALPSSSSAHNHEHPSLYRYSSGDGHDASISPPPYTAMPDVTDWSIEDVLASEDLVLPEFYLFCQSLLSDHLMLFILALRPYHHQPLPHETLLTIYRKYIHQGSSQCVPLSSQLVKAIKEYCEPAGDGKVAPPPSPTMTDVKANRGSFRGEMGGGGGVTDDAHEVTRAPPRRTSSYALTIMAPASSAPPHEEEQQQQDPAPMSTIAMLMEVVYLEILTNVAQELLPMFKDHMARVAALAATSHFTDYDDDNYDGSFFASWKRHEAVASAQQRSSVAPPLGASSSSSFDERP